MINTIKIDTRNPVNYFGEYELTKEEIEFLNNMAEEGNAQEAVDIFIENYIVPPGTKYSDLMRNYLELSASGVIDSQNETDLLRNISVITLALSALLLSNFSLFTRSVYAKVVFKEADLTKPDVKRSLINEIIATYDQSLSGALSQTQSFVLNSIRSVQRDMIAKNLFFEKFKPTPEVVKQEIIKFKDALRKKYPSMFKAIEDGNIIVSRKFIDGVEKVRHYKLDYYADMATRTILYDVDRTTNMLMAVAAGERVMEYILADPRKVKKDREICQEILLNKILGKSLLALDEDAAAMLGIMTVDEAMNTPDHAMSVFCRHSVRRLDKIFLKEIDNLLKESA